MNVFFSNKCVNYKCKWVETSNLVQAVTELSYVHYNDNGNADDDDVDSLSVETKSLLCYE